MRTIVKLAAAAGVVALAACSGNDRAMNSDLQKDLELASTASEITLPASQPAAQVVSAIERNQPVARRVAKSQRAPKHRPAPRALPAPVEAENAELSAEVEPQPVEVSPTPAEVAPLPSPRPQPVASTGTGGGDVRIGSGRGDEGVGGDRGVGIGTGIGTIIGVVLRGGIVDGDECDPRTDGRRRGNGGIAVIPRSGGTISINNRIPVVGTFPGSGRLGTAATVGGMILSGGGPIGGRATGGRTRF